MNLKKPGNLLGFFLTYDEEIHCDRQRISEKK